MLVLHASVCAYHEILKCSEAVRRPLANEAVGRPLATETEGRPLDSYKALAYFVVFDMMSRHSPAVQCAGAAR